METTTPTAIPQLSKHRIEALVDGIFAVAMTLLVIELRLPEHLHAATDAQLREALSGLAPTFFSWLVSFFVLALFWVANHRLYSHVRHVDAPLLWYTILMLGGVALLPFASAVNGRFLSQLAQLLYASVMIVIAIGTLLVCRRIFHHPQLCTHPMDRPTYIGVCIRTSALIVIAVLTVLLAGWMPGATNFAFLLLFAVRPLSFALVRRIRSGGQAPTASAD